MSDIICSRCKNKKKAEDFDFKRFSSERLKTCRSCYETVYRWKEKNPSKDREIQKESSKKWYRKVKDTPEYKGKMRVYNKEYREKHGDSLSKKNKEWKNKTGWYHKIQKPRLQKPEWRFQTYKKSADRANIQFLLSFEDYMTYWGKDCYYCGEQVKNGGLDRVDSRLGYTIRNVVSCCTFCNFMKKNFPKGDFLSQIKKIANNHGL